MVTVGEVWLLGTYMALPCDWQYDGCTLYKKSYINDWKHGTAFGYYEKSNFYQHYSKRQSSHITTCKRNKLSITAIELN